MKLLFTIWCFYTIIWLKYIPECIYLDIMMQMSSEMTEDSLVLLHVDSITMVTITTKQICKFSILPRIANRCDIASRFKMIVHNIAGAENCQVRILKRLRYTLWRLSVNISNCDRWQNWLNPFILSSSQWGNIKLDSDNLKLLDLWLPGGEYLNNWDW